MNIKRGIQRISLVIAILYFCYFGLIAVVKVRQCQAGDNWACEGAETAGLALIGVPLLIAVIILIGRWVARGFKHG
jgi:hypothetical protein